MRAEGDQPVAEGVTAGQPTRGEILDVRGETAPSPALARCDDTVHAGVAARGELPDRRQPRSETPPPRDERSPVETQLRACLASVGALRRRRRRRPSNSWSAPPATKHTAPAKVPQSTRPG